MMYTSILFTALAATGAFAQTLDPNSVAVTLNNATLGGDTTFEAALFPETKGPVADIPGPYDTVTLTLGSAITDTALRCQIADPEGNIIKVNRGRNICKSTFSAGDPWAFSGGLTEVQSVTCTVLAPDGE